MRYMLYFNANKYAFNDCLKVSSLSDGSWRKALQGDLQS